MQNQIIKISNLSVKYVDSDKNALNNINLDIADGKIITIMGPAGAGKTTLLLTLNGIIPNSVKVSMEGNVEVNGLNTKKFGVKEFARFVGVVFQDPDNQLFCASVEEEVGYALSNHGLPREVIKERVRESLENVRLEGYEDRIPQGLSGGEKQRVVLASALSLYPKILVLDEPTSQLDPMGTDEVFTVLKHLRNDKKITIVLAEHKSEDIAEIADYVVVLKEGKMVLNGSPREIFSQQDLVEKFGIRGPQISEATNILKRYNHYRKLYRFIPITHQESLEIFKTRSG